MSETHARRRNALRAVAAGRDLDAVLVTSLPNVRYLTGFTGSNGALLVHVDGADVFGTDFRYRAQSAEQVPGVERVINRRTVPALAERAGADHARRLGYESHIVTVDGLTELTRALPGVELASIGRAVEELRAVKDEEELDLLRRACAIADRALADLLAAGGIRPGRTEREIALELERRMLELGADAPSFESIVAAGPHSAVPHHRPGARTVERGDLVKLDFGATYGGYHSDMTRTFVVGEPAAWQAEIYALVAEAQRVGRVALAVGADVRAVDRAARDVIDDAGHKDNYGHGLGHGVGLEIHEAPAVGPTGTGTLAARMPVTVEPGVYLEGRGGVRIEDTLVVREDGPELLTMTSKNLTVV